MSFASIARVSSSLSIGGIFVAMIISAASSATPTVKSSGTAGTYSVSATVPWVSASHCSFRVSGSKSSYLREVDLNDLPLLEGVDYTIVEDGSDTGSVKFTNALLEGDRVEILGATLDAGLHTGKLSFD